MEPASFEPSKIQNETLASNKSSHRRGCQLPSEFQKEIIAMDIETFKNQTNIIELIERDFKRQQNGRRAITQADYDFGLQKYYEFRVNHQKWHSTSLKNLKHKTCECRRHKEFADASTAMDVQQVQDIGVQCCPQDFGDGTAQPENATQQLEQPIPCPRAVHQSTIQQPTLSQQPFQQSFQQPTSSGTRN